MPPVSTVQRKAMFAAAEGKSNIGIPAKVGKEFTNADPGGKLPNRAHDHARLDAAIGLLGRYDREFNESDHPRDSDGEFTTVGGDKGKGLSDKEKKTLIEYGGGHSYNVNRYLRDPKAGKNEAKKHFGSRSNEYIKDLETTSKIVDAAVAKSKLNKNTDLYRGVSDFAHIRDIVSNLKSGESFTLPTFSSTSRSKEWASDFMSGKSGDKGMMVINARAGSNALDMDQFARHGSEEQEMLIGRNQPLIFDRYDSKTKTVYLTLTAKDNNARLDAAIAKMDSLLEKIGRHDAK